MVLLWQSVSHEQSPDCLLHIEQQPGLYPTAWFIVLTMGWMFSQQILYHVTAGQAMELLMTVMRWCFIHVLMHWCCWHTSCLWLQSGDDSVILDHRCVYWAHAANNWWRLNTRWKINHRPVIPVSVSRLWSEITLNALVLQKEFRAFVKGQLQWCHSVVKLHCG